MCVHGRVQYFIFSYKTANHCCYEICVDCTSFVELWCAKYIYFIIWGCRLILFIQCWISCSHAYFNRVCSLIIFADKVMIQDSGTSKFSVFFFNLWNACALFSFHQVFPAFRSSIFITQSIKLMESFCCFIHFIYFKRQTVCESDIILLCDKHWSRGLCQ